MDNPLFVLKRAYLATRKAVDDTLAPYDLTSSQFDVMLYLWRQDGQEQRALQECLGITSASLTGIIDGLVERGFVERRLNRDDSRVKQLFLTDEGRALREQLRDATQMFLGQMFEGFSSAESALLMQWLRKVAVNMGDESNDICG